MALALRWSGRIWAKAMREASSMATWTNSQPMPRLLLWPVRSPVMRWPTRSNRPSLFDVEMEEFPRPLAFVAQHRCGRLQGAQPVQPQALEDAADGGRRDLDLERDLPAGAALAAEGGDLFDHGGGSGPVQPCRPRAAVGQAGKPFRSEPPDPFAHGPQTDAVSQSHGRAGLTLLQHPPHQFRSTVRRQARILVDVHSVPPREDEVFDKPQLPRSGPSGQPPESSHLGAGTHSDRPWPRLRSARSARGRARRLASTLSESGGLCRRFRVMIQDRLG